MNDDQTRPLGSEPPAPPPLPPSYGGTGGSDVATAPLPGTTAPSYDAASRQPRFVDRVLGMRAVIAVALASLVVGGLGGALLGATTNGGDDGFGRGPGGFQPGTFQGGPNGQSQLPIQQNGQVPHQQFGQGQTP